MTSTLTRCLTCGHLAYHHHCGYCGTCDRCDEYAAERQRGDYADDTDGGDQ